MRSWRAAIGAAQYFRSASVSYRFSSYDVEHLGRTSGHLVGAKLDDPYGSNQLWLGHGNSPHDTDWLATPEKGKFNSAELRRPADRRRPQRNGRRQADRI